MMSWDEKRQYKRAYVKIPVECRGGRFWQYVKTKDISAGGMFIATDKIEPLQTKVEIMFEIGEGEKKFIHADAVVTWVRLEPIKDETGQVQPIGMGIMFTKITPIAAKDYIDEIIKKAEGEGKNA